MCDDLPCFLQAASSVDMYDRPSCVCTQTGGASMHNAILSLCVEYSDILDKSFLGRTYGLHNKLSLHPFITW